jgi:Raf kinase inhibitor-like YbhB/YbcL family protein
MKTLLASLLVIILLAACSPASGDSDDGGEGLPTSYPRGFSLTSEAFEAGGAIPEANSCDGVSDSPPLAWEKPPDGVLSFALIMRDPDAPGGDFVHWILYNIPPGVSDLPPTLPGLGGIAHTGEHGVNSVGTQSYVGPCPPSGTHRYYFSLYALDTELALDAAPDAAELASAMDGHVLGQAVPMGTTRESKS